MAETSVHLRHYLLPIIGQGFNYALINLHNVPGDKKEGLVFYSPPFFSLSLLPPFLPFSFHLFTCCS